MKKRVAVAMSGGVDSSVAALLLKEKGYEVIGITLQIWPKFLGEKSGDFGGCCSLEAIEDAQKVSWKLKIPHYVLNFRDIFEQEIIQDFVSQYKKGFTPNPCVRCNRIVKFKFLLEKIREFGADYLATGHYAQIVSSKDGSTLLLKKSKDKKKDQTYFLYQLNQEIMKKVIFPVGEKTKEQIRKIAREHGLVTAEKKESQEICFIVESDYRKFFKEHFPNAFQPGSIINKEGCEIGKHKGIPFYTIGQRSGLGISSHSPYYVTSIDRKRNIITVGREKDLYGKEFIVAGVNWVSDKKPSSDIKARVRIRYRFKEVGAEIELLENKKARVIFDEKQRAITPGQSGVFYQGDFVLGGGVISKVIN